ncbi:MAG: hypothetical protein Q8N36_02030, partial [bacterium]|nr:hypothetical protein [bacterium]
MGRNNEGSIMIFSLIVITVLLIIGSAFLSFSTAEFRAVQSHTNSMQAFYLAESGVNHYIKELSARGATGMSASLMGTLTGIGSYSVVRTSLGESVYLVTSTGTTVVGNAKSTLYARVTVQGYLPWENFMM